MKNKPTLTHHLAGSHQAEMERYQAIVAEARRYLGTFAAPLQAVTEPLFEKMVQGEFSQVAALLPYWLADLAPVPPEVSHRLGVAHLYFWWYYYVQDELLDGDASLAALLSGHLALLKMVDTYRELGLTRAPCWADYHRLARLSAEAHALELQTRFTNPAELTPNRLASVTLDFIGHRVAPLFFNPMAQLHLAGIPADHPLHHDLIAALRCFAIARQLGDDASDWLEDLQAGHLNYVSAHLMRRLYQRGLATSGTDLDPERLAGYHLTDEAFWTEIEQTNQTLSQQALDHLAPYGNCRLRSLIQNQMAQHVEQWAAGRTYRANLRQLFGIGGEK